MKKHLYSFIVIISSLLIIIVLDKININDNTYAINYIQQKVSTCEKNITKNELGNEDVIIFQNTNNTLIHLSDWGIDDYREILQKRFIVNNTGWYWILHTNHKYYILRFQRTFPVNNQYLHNHYAKCLDIPDDYELEYSETAKEIKDNNGNYLPITLKYYPKYKSKLLANINAFLYCAWWLLLFHFFIQLFSKIWWSILSLLFILLLRWIFSQWDILFLLKDSILYDSRVYAFPKVYFLQSLGEVLISVLTFSLYAHYSSRYKHLLLSYSNAIVQTILLVSCIYLFTHHSSFTLHFIDYLFYDYPYWTHSIIALMILFFLMLHLAFLLTSTVFKEYSFYQYGLMFLGILCISAYLIFYYQNKNIKHKVEYIFNWIENEEELAMFEQIQTIDKYLSKITHLEDSIYFKNITNIENISIYLQLSKRYLFDDSISLNAYLKDKKKIWNNVYINTYSSSDKLKEYFNKPKNITINTIYYINKIDKKYLLSEFEYFLPFSNTSYYSFLSDKLFQLPSGFKDFDISYYDQNKLKFKLGNLPFPAEFLGIEALNSFYPDYIHHYRLINDKQIIVSHPKRSFTDFLSLFSTYFIVLLTIFMIVFYVYYAWRYQHLFPIHYLSYLYKITGLVMFILVISFYMLLMISYRYTRELLDEEIKEQLLKEAQNLKKDNIPDDVILFKKNGYIQTIDESNVLMRFKLLSPKLPDEWVKKILHNKYSFMKRKVGNYEYTSLFTLLNTSTIAELSYYDEQFFIEKNLKSLLHPLFRIYALLFFISFLLGISLSNYVVSPIRHIARQLQTPLELKTIPYQSNDELGDLVNNYNRLVLRLHDVLEQLKKEQQEKAWKIMAQQVAHDIKNSLTPLLLSIEYWKKKESSTNGGIIHSIQQQVQTLARIAEDFSEFAQDVQVKLENVNIKTLVENIIAPYQAQQDIEISLSVSSNTPLLIHTDAYLLSRIITNLIKNSIEAISGKGKILIELYQENTWLTLAITDNGCGISDAIKEKIFEPKFSTKTSGKGLGLSIVKNLCDKLSIRIHFQTQVNQGTTFYLNIPL